MLKDIEKELAEILLDNVLSKKGKPTYKEVASEVVSTLNPLNKTSQYQKPSELLLSSLVSVRGNLENSCLISIKEAV